MVDRITPAELRALQDTREEFTLVDTRSAEDYEAFHIKGARNFRFVPDNGTGDDEIREAFVDIDEEERIVLICAKGISAADLVDRLGDMGYGNVQMVNEGMLGWSKTYNTVPLPIGGDAEVIQLQRRAKGCLGYIVGSQPDGQAVVIDPTRHLAAFRDAATNAGYEIKAILDTHIHADHISGAPALAAELDAQYYLSTPASKRGVDHDHKTIDPNDVLEVGSVDIKLAHTPGHTEGMVTPIIDTAAALTADTLHLDSVGRVELAFEDGDVGTGARMLYESLHQTILSLPDETAVYPGHFTVTPDGEYENATPGVPIGTTIAAARTELDVLGLDEASFVDRLTEDVPEKPPNYETIIETNRGRAAPDSEEEAEQLELGPNNCGA